MRAAQRKRVAWGDLLVGLAILVTAVVLAFLLFPRSGQALSAQVVQDGELILSCRLDDLKQPMTFRVEGLYPLVLELSANGVKVAETSCPGGDCLHQGTISEAERQIICLPNRLVVTLQGETLSYDAITG